VIDEAFDLGAADPLHGRFLLIRRGKTQHHLVVLEG
jgi:hypothetical protein